MDLASFENASLRLKPNLSYDVIDYDASYPVTNFYAANFRSSGIGGGTAVSGNTAKILILFPL